MAFLRPGAYPIRPALPPREQPALILPEAQSAAASTYQKSEQDRRRHLASSRPYQLSLTRQLPLTYLEVTSVTAGTLKDYRQRLTELYSWAFNHGHQWTSPEELDSVLVQLFDVWFWEGLPVDRGTKLIAALKFFRVLDPTLAELMTLPRSSRALKAWTRAAPPNQRLPLPYVALVAIVGFALWRGEWMTAVCLYFQFRTYLRPGACDALKVKQLIRPQPAAGLPYWALVVNPVEDRIPGKTGLYDSSVLWDTDLWFGSVLDLLVNNRQPEGLLWTCPPAHIIAVMQAATEWLNLNCLAPCRYSLRHGGASDDLVQKRRALDVVKKRGQWVTDTSLRRYAKESRLQGEVAKIDPSVLRYASDLINILPSVFLGLMPPPVPPRPVRPAGLVR